MNTRMKMNVSRSTLCVALALAGIFACNKKQDDAPTSASTSSSATDDSKKDKDKSKDENKKKGDDDDDQAMKPVDKSDDDDDSTNPQATEAASVPVPSDYTQAAQATIKPEDDYKKRLDQLESEIGKE